jgi:hypothetical protein
VPVKISCTSLLLKEHKSALKFNLIGSVVEVVRELLFSLLVLV